MEDPSILQFFRPQGLFPAVVVLGVAWFLARLTEGAFERAGTRFTEYRLTLNQTKAIIRLVLWLGGMAAAISLVFQLSDEALLALGGTLAVAIGIALRDLVASIIAGVTILIDKPFQVGDRISYGGVYGEVVEIGLRAVRLVTLDDNLVTIPNNKFLTDIVASGNAVGRFRGVFVVGRVHGLRRAPSAWPVGVVAAGAAVAVSGGAAAGGAAG